MRVLEQMEPSNVFYYFEELCKIPHGSGNTAGISDFCASFAKTRNLWFVKDEMGNLVIKKPASKGYEDSDPIILQGHLDMVLQQDPDNRLDLTKDSLVLGVDGDWIHANGTTLGGDNGIAVAMMLALLDGDYVHPALECVFTIDEEIGLIGADALDTSCLDGRQLINLDSEEEGIFTVGCAGGVTGNCMLPVRRYAQCGKHMEITLKGLSGGHSGVDIDKERGNANKLMARLLARLDDVMNFALVSLNGGTVDNAIASIAKASILIDPEDTSLFAGQVEEFASIIKHEHRVSDPKTEVLVEDLGEVETDALDAKSKTLALYLLNMIPNGVQKRSIEIEHLVQTSCNLGIVNLSDHMLQLGHSIRSSVKSEKEALSDQVRMCVEFLGGTYELQGDYPGWEYEKDSRLQSVMSQVYEKMFGAVPRIEAIHAGLECGIFCDRMEGLSCISIGPNMQEIHSSRERLSISSVKRTWEFVLGVLKSLK